MENIDNIKARILESKSKISELDVLLSKIDGLDSPAIEDDHIPTDGQFFIYQFVDAVDKQPGIFVPGPTVSLAGTVLNEESIVSGRLQVDSDSSFICTDLQGIPQFFWSNVNGGSNDPPPGTYWTPLSRSDLGFRYSGVSLGATTHLWGIDFGFKFIDEGTGRRLFQGNQIRPNDISLLPTGAAYSTNVGNRNDEVFVPGKFLGSGMPYSPFGPNYTSPLSFRHVFSKNTAVRCDLKIHSLPNAALSDFGSTPAPPVNSVRVFIGLLGYKVYGD